MNKTDGLFVRNGFVESRDTIFRDYGLDIYKLCVFFNIKTPVNVEFDAYAETWENQSEEMIDVGESVIGIDENNNPVWPRFIVTESTLWSETFKWEDITNIKHVIKVQHLDGGATMKIWFIQMIGNRPEKLTKLRRKIEEILRKSKDPKLLPCLFVQLQHWMQAVTNIKTLQGGTPDESN